MILTFVQWSLVAAWAPEQQLHWRWRNEGVYQRSWFWDLYRCLCCYYDPTHLSCLYHHWMRTKMDVCVIYVTCEVSYVLINQLLDLYDDLCVCVCGMFEILKNTILYLLQFPFHLKPMRRLCLFLYSLVFHLTEAFPPNTKFCSSQWILVIKENITVFILIVQFLRFLLNQWISKNG